MSSIRVSLLNTSPTTVVTVGGGGETKSTSNSNGGIAKSFTTTNSQSSDFFTQGITRTLPRKTEDLLLSSSSIKTNHQNYLKEGSESETLGRKLNSPNLFEWEKSKSLESTSENKSPDANANVNYKYEKYDRTFSTFQKKSGSPVVSTQESTTTTAASSKLYEKAIDLANGVCTLNRKFAPLWSLLLTYPSELHYVGRVALMSAVTGVVIGKTLEDLASTLDFQLLSNRLDKVLEHNFIDGTDPTDPGRVGVNKDFL